MWIEPYKEKAIHRINEWQVLIIGYFAVSLVMNLVQGTLCKLDFLTL